jgi:hypothetical protein
MNRYLQRLIIRSYTTDGRDGYRKGAKSFKDKKSNKTYGYMTEGLKKIGISSVKTHQNAPIFEEALTEMEERYMEYVDLMRFKVLFPREVIRFTQVLDKEETR